jgi:hypothetical protein
MTSRAGVIAIVIAVVVVTAGALLLTTRSRGRSGEEVGAAKSGGRPQALPQVQVKGAELEEKGADGQVRWRVTAGGALQYDKDGERVIGEDVKFVIIQKQQTPVTVTAAHFTADNQARKLTFEQGVQGQLTGKAGSFAVTRLEYQFDTGKLVGSGGASFDKGSYKATARELVVDTAAMRVRLRGGVRFAASG